MIAPRSTRAQTAGLPICRYEWHTLGIRLAYVMHTCPGGPNG